ncbi:NAD-dependent epimerase/dehydratase family protein [Oceanobacillus halophilus]|uniref:NAD-dependent epimerase/dehydratase family protein n=1 Tax=Oceanobacillus halophilus TaxID=930130 RepID=A0A495A500_9BACI|nr:NAD-dependent epimerase/dehydratase family protein [Oceanobacillus halophilus]RKQ33419.1 NAD-dependent epimerase/dehydratase family protein [Oceanobacillus halophilus]
MKRILVTGALGQIGTELVDLLRKTYGISNVIATDIRESKNAREKGPFELLDVTDEKSFALIAKRHNVDTMIHLASILSANAEKNPLSAWNINMSGLWNALEVSREMNLQFFTPSSIGAFGQLAPKENTPQVTIQRPITIYGINKVAGELLCDYYFMRYGLDTRGIRFPGLISYVTPPGGGTTDYAVEIYHEAINSKKYISYIRKGTYLDMMYMPDALHAIIELMETNPENLVHRNAYNISAFSAAPENFAESIRQHIPDFTLDYNVDPVRQKVAESWPNHLDCTAAKEEWGFKANYDLEKVTEDMLKNISREERLLKSVNAYKKR